VRPFFCGGKANLVVGAFTGLEPQVRLPASVFVDDRQVGGGGFDADHIHARVAVPPLADLLEVFADGFNLQTQAG